MGRFGPKSFRKVYKNFLECWSFSLMTIIIESCERILAPLSPYFKFSIKIICVNLFQIDLFYLRTLDGWIKEGGFVYR